MEKQKIKSHPQKHHFVWARIFYGAGIAIGILIICGVLFFRNPFLIPSTDASDSDASLEKSEGDAYVRVKHMDLQFTGFYTVDTKEKICGYYYIGTIGDESWFVEVAAKTGDGGLSQAMPDLKDYNFFAETSDASDILKKASESEGLTVDAYLEKYHISDKVLLTYDTHREADILYYVIGVFSALGCFVAGRLFSHEA